MQLSRCTFCYRWRDIEPFAINWKRLVSYRDVGSFALALRLLWSSWCYFWGLMSTPTAMIFSAITGLTYWVGPDTDQSIVVGVDLDAAVCNARCTHDSSKTPHGLYTTSHVQLTSFLSPTYTAASLIPANKAPFLLPLDMVGIIKRGLYRDGGDFFFPRRVWCSTGEAPGTVIPLSFTVGVLGQCEYSTWENARTTTAPPCPITIVVLVHVAFIKLKYLIFLEIQETFLAIFIGRMHVSLRDCCDIDKSQCNLGQQGEGGDDISLRIADWQRASAGARLKPKPVFFFHCHRRSSPSPAPKFRLEPLFFICTTRSLAFNLYPLGFYLAEFYLLMNWLSTIATTFYLEKLLRS